MNKKNMLKTITIGVVAAALTVVTPTAVLAQSNNGSSNEGNKVTICHATGSQTNPFVQISPNANGVISGHVEHQHTGDIIPSFSYNDKGTTKNFPGQNLDARGQATLNNNCVVPAGGQGGGVQTQGGQVLGSAAGGQGAGGQGSQAQAPAGAVAAGFGGGATDISWGALVGLGTSLLSIGSGFVLLNRYQA